MKYTTTTGLPVPNDGLLVALTTARLATEIHRGVDPDDGEPYTSIGVRTNEEAAQVALETLVAYLKKNTPLDIDGVLAKAATGEYMDPSYG